MGIGGIWMGFWGKRLMGFWEFLCLGLCLLETPFSDLEVGGVAVEFDKKIL